jgi:hypothetical protein
MSADGKTTAVGVFADRTHAEFAVEDLLQAGFTREQIGFVTPDAAAGIEPPPPIRPSTKAGEGAAAGAVGGLTLGSLLGVALATAVLPGVGPVIAGGLLAGLVGGAVAGLTGGGILGALIGLKIPEEEARRYEREFHSGRTLVTVQAGDRYEEAVAILESAAARRDPARHGHSRGELSRLEDETPPPGQGTVFTPRP